MGLLLLAAAVASLLPIDTAVENRFDAVHHNRHYSDDGRLVVDQVWWEDWRADHARHDIAAWRLTRRGTCRSPLPLRNHATGLWVSIWWDGDVLRVVRARSFRRSWTQGADPEVKDRARHADWRRARRDLATRP